MLYVVALLMFLAGFGRYSWKVGAGLSAGVAGVVIVSAMILHPDPVAINWLSIVALFVVGIVAFYGGRGAARLFRKD